MNKELKRELRFSLFHNESLGIQNTIPEKEIGIRELFDIYQSEDLEQTSIKLKYATGEEKDELKKKLPFITPSGTFTKRKSEFIQHYNSHLLSFDIDGLTELDAPRLRDHFSKIDGCIFSGVSARLKGVKALFNTSCEIPLDDKYITLKSNLDNIAEALGLKTIQDKIDLAQFVLPQPFFLAYDKDAFYCEDFSELDLELEKYEPKLIEAMPITSVNVNHSRIESYLKKATNNIINTFASCGEGSRHFNIVKVKSISSWTHYAPHLESELKQALLNAVISMYGDERNANKSGAIRTFNECWESSPQPNKAIEEIINELQTSEQ